MAIGFRQFSSGDVHLPGTTVTITKPAGTASTDILVAFFGSGRGAAGVVGTWTAPAGWTAIAANVQVTASNHIDLAGFWASGSVAGLGFSRSGTVDDMGWVCLGFTGVNGTTPVDATGTTNSATGSASIVANAVTVATDQAWHVVGLTSWAGGTWSATGFTLKQNADVNQDVTCAYNPTPKSVGSTGTATFTTTGGSSGQLLAAMPFALRPAPAVASLPPFRPAWRFQTRRRFS